MIITKSNCALNIKQQDAYEMMLNLPKASVDLVLTDPPYGMIKASWDDGINYEAFWRGVHHCAKPNAAILVFGCNKFTIQMAASNLDEYRYRFVWDKSSGPITGVFNSHKMPLNAYEDIVVFYRKLPTYNYRDCMRQGFAPYVRGKYGEHRRCGTPSGGCYGKCPIRTKVQSVHGERFPINILKYSKELKRGVHATMKPVALLEYLIRMYSNAGDLVVDPFLGSGNTAIACVNTGRNFIGCDINQEFVECTIKRAAETLA